MRVVFERLDNFQSVMDYLSQLHKGREILSFQREQPVVNTNFINHLLPEQSVREEESSLSKAMGRVLDKRFACGIDFIEENFAPLDGEEVSAYDYTYIIHKYEDLPIGTPVISRTTNYTKAYFIFEDARWDSDSLITENTSVATNCVFSSSPMSDATGLTILTNLALAVINGFMGKAGAAIFDLIFGKSPIFFDEMYMEIKKIIKESLAQNEVDKIDGYLKGVVQDIVFRYMPQKNGSQPADRKELMDILSPIYQKIGVEACGLLQQSSFEKPGFSVFLVASLMNITILQEMAYIDYKYLTPTDSPYAKTTIPEYAQAYLKHFDSTYKKIESDRKAQISMKYIVEEVPHSTEVVYIYYWKWSDAKTGDYMCFRAGGKNDSSETDCRNSMNDHIRTQLSNMSTQFGIDTYRSTMIALATKPLPKI